MSKVIVGAGLAGLIAACHFKDAHIIDAASGPMATHQALLRFRSTAVSELTGIPFKKVTVQKAIYEDGLLKSSCSIRSANQYAYKVSGGVKGRSITNLEPSVRWIAPDNFYDQLIDRHGAKILWGVQFTEEYLKDHREFPDCEIISTAPMAVNLSAAGVQHGTSFGSFAKAPIDVWRIKLNVPCEAYQTIYFPDPDNRLFRASITGDTLIVELLQQVPGAQMQTGIYSDQEVEDMLLDAFGIPYVAVQNAEVNKTTQPFGKIVDMPASDRQALLHELTNAHGIFSLGRFATWRNILLDDVVDDIESIDKLINASEYSRKLLSVK